MGPTKRALVVIAFTLASCSSQMIPAATPTTNSTILRLYAATSVLPLANDLTAAYSQRYPTLTFDIAGGNYETVVERVVGEDNVYAIANHLPVESPLMGFPIAQDGLAVIVHPDNDLSNLTTEQLRLIYQGRIANWADVGGPDRDIVVMTREDGSGSRAEFERLVMGDRRTTRSAQIAPSSGAMVTSVSREAGAIGFVSMSYVTPSVRAVSVDDVAPTRENVAENTYPLRATIFIIGRAEPQGNMRAFVGWAQSPEGQAIVARQYAPLLAP